MYDLIPNKSDFLGNLLSSMGEKKKLNRIKIVLAEKEKTNADLAKALDKNQATISRWCTNDAQPGLETLFEIADFLDIEVSELIQKRKS